MSLFSLEVALDMGVYPHDDFHWGGDEKQWHHEHITGGCCHTSSVSDLAIFEGVAKSAV